MKKSLTTSHSIISPTPITQKTIQAISPKPVQSISKSTPKRVTPQKKSSLSVKKSSAHTAATHTATTHTATDHTATTSSLPQSLSDLTSSSDSEEETEQLTHHIDEETLYEEEKELSSETEEDSLDVTLAEMKLTLEDYHQIAQQMATAGRLEVVSTSMKPLAIQCVIFDESTQKIRFIVKN